MDIRNISEEALGILSNKEIIAINQDPLVKQAKMVNSVNGMNIWVKELSNNFEFCIGFVNMNDTHSNVKILLIKNI